MENYKFEPVKNDKPECIPCKIISYSAATGLSVYALCLFRGKKTIEGTIIGIIGVTVLSTFIRRDLSKLKTQT